MPDLVSLAAAVALETVDSRETGYSPSLDAGIATRPIEILQPIQALAQARSDYLDAVLAHKRDQLPPVPRPRPPPRAPGPGSVVEDLRESRHLLVRHPR